MLGCAHQVYDAMLLRFGPGAETNKSGILAGQACCWHGTCGLFSRAGLAYSVL